MAEQCPNPIPGCRYRDTDQCIRSVHHSYWPAKEYTTPLQKRFRNLPANKVVMERCVHDLEHVVADPPPMPPLEVMREAVQQEQTKRRNGMR